MIAILDYEAGNQTSVYRAFASLQIPAVITRDPKVLHSASGVLFPGVGAAGQAMDMLKRTGLDAELANLVAAKKPLLGICLGCQILLESSEEDNTKTLGLVKGKSKIFPQGLVDEEGAPIIIPHMGWNSVQLTQPCRLFDGIPAYAEYYFVHSFYTEPDPNLIVATTTHGMEFCSVFGRDGFWALQFHPEKSGKAGLAILRNFYEYSLEAARA